MADNEQVNDNSSQSQPDEEPIRLDDETDAAGISHAPLTLGGSTAGDVPVAHVKIAKKTKKPTETLVSSPERITGVKTFFTKLAPGSIEFMDGQIANWLKEHPQITIKKTNTATGNVIAKTSEPNIIVTVWY